MENSFLRNVKGCSLKQSIIFLGFISIFNQSHGKKVDKISSLTSIKYQKNDLLFAQNLDLFIKKTNDLTLDIKILRTLKKLLGQKNTFHHYSKLIKKTSKLIHKNRIFDLCLYLRQRGNISRDPLENEWNDAITYYCEDHVLEHLIKTQKLGRYKVLFDWALGSYLKGRHTVKFLKLLQKASKKSKFKGHLLDLISNKIIAKNIIPENQILRKLEINNQLTEFLQQKGLNKQRESRFFLNEFKSLTQLMLKDNDPSLILEFYNNNTKYLNKDLVFDSLIYMGVQYLRQKDFEKSNSLILTAKDFSTVEKEEEILFFLLWPFIVNKDFSQGSLFIRKNRMLKKFHLLSSKTKFWIGHCLHHNGEIKLARELYEKIIDRSPTSYYAILSLKFLRKIYHSANEKILFEQQEELASLNLNVLTPKLKNIIKRIVLWLEVGRINFYDYELQNFLNYLKRKGNKKLKSILIFKLIKVLNAKEEYLQAFKLSLWAIEKEVLNFSPDLLKTLFPLPFVKYIKKIDSSMDPLFILSLIRQESAFDPEAKSSAGARGLMQIMPHTAKFLAKRKISIEHLYTPKLNLKLGINYLKRLLKKYNGNLIYTLAAYNAGEQRVKKWGPKYLTSTDPLVLVESIPFKETRKYIKLIYRNIFYYRYLMKGDNIFLPINDSFSITLN
jgi:soluble lytic murein transglycosylase